MNTAIHISKFKQGQQKPSGPSVIQVMIAKYEAKKEAKRVVKSLKEVKDFESGKKQPKSFDDFLGEL